MTLGEKLKLLLKENCMTQEDLAERLEVSRQAVGKWVNDKGMPEVNKLLQISDMFGVSMDYLLKENYESDYLKKREGDHENDYEEKNILNNGYYVSEEMLDGYLLYSKKNINQITAGISIFIFSNIFESFGYRNTILGILYWITMITGVIILVWHFFQIKQYQEIKTQHLIFDDKVIEEFRKQREERRRTYTIMIIVGVVILFAGPEIENILMIQFGSVVGNVCGWVIDTMWLALIIWAGMSMHIDNIVIRNVEQIPKNNPMKRYRWIYAALPITACAVFIGIISNAWSPYAPIIILFCCLLVTTCKLLIESRR